MEGEGIFLPLCCQEGIYNETETNYLLPQGRKMLANLYYILIAAEPGEIQSSVSFCSV